MRPDPFSSPRINPARHRQPMPSESVDIIRLEPHIGIDPQRLLEPIGQGIAAHLIASLVNRRVPLDPPHHIPPPLELQQSRLTLRNNPPLKRHQHHTPRRRRVHPRRRGGAAEGEVVIRVGIHRQSLTDQLKSVPLASALTRQCWDAHHPSSVDSRSPPLAAQSDRQWHPPPRTLPPLPDQQCHPADVWATPRSRENNET